MVLNLIERLAAHARGAPAAKPLPGDAPLPENFLSAEVDAMDRVPERIRASQPGFIHVSSLTDLCPRQLVLMRAEDRPLIRSVTGGHRVMWRLGRAVESHIREQIIKSRNSNGLLGRWTCRCGESVHVGTIDRQVRCVACQGPLDVYGEYTLWDRDEQITGNPDLLVQHRDTVVVTEIKSMNRMQWEKLLAPLGNHVFQTGMYYDLALKEGLRPHREGVFLYCVKEFMYGSPYKEYHVDLAAPHLVRQREAVRAQLREALEAERRGALPPRQRCASPTCAAAKACPVATSCFNRD